MKVQVQEHLDKPIYIEFNNDRMTISEDEVNIFLRFSLNSEDKKLQSLNETNQTNYSTISTNEQNGTEDAKGSNCE